MRTSEIFENLEQYFLEAINGHGHRKRDIIFRSSLFAFSRVYRRIVQFRHWLYDKRIFRDRTLGCLVVSIGNLTCGGTGKTPVVEVFARSLSGRGRKVAILSRGYRSKDRSFIDKVRKALTSKRHEVPPRIVSDGTSLLLNSAMAGDEPYMLASNLKDVIVLVDKDRVKSGLYAITEYGADTLILDDGFQYLDLKPRINIVLVDSTKPFHNHHVLPRGLLREPIKNITRADYIFLTKSNGGNHLRYMKAFLRRHNRRAEIIECCHKPLYLEDVYDEDDRLPLDALKGRNICAMSGIACPESFENFLSGYGAEIVCTRQFADHHRYTQQELIDIVNDARKAGAEMLLTTEKDAVRLPRLDRRDIPIYFMRVEIDIISGQESFEQCISRICFS